MVALIKPMHLLEASHALAGLPTVTPASLLASRRGNQPFSTKLPDQHEDRRSPSSPGNPLQWLQTNIIVPARSTLGRVNVQPMVDSFRVARNRLSFGSSTLRASQRPTLLATHPTLTAVEEPEGELPAHEREPEDPCVTNLPLGSHTSKNPDKTADSLGSDMNPKGEPLGNPATKKNINSSNSLGSLVACFRLGSHRKAQQTKTYPARRQLPSTKSSANKDPPLQCKTTTTTKTLKSCSTSWSS